MPFAVHKIHIAKGKKFLSSKLPLSYQRRLGEKKKQWCTKHNTLRQVKKTLRNYLIKCIQNRSYLQPYGSNLTVVWGVISLISCMLSAKNERDLSEVRGLEVNNLKGNVSILLICMVRTEKQNRKKKRTWEVVLVQDRMQQGTDTSVLLTI